MNTKVKSGKKQSPKHAATKEASSAATTLPASDTKPAGKTLIRLPSAWQLSRQAGRLLWQHRRLWGGLLAVYGLLELFLVQNLTGVANVNALKAQLGQPYGRPGSLAASLTIFGHLLGSDGNSSAAVNGAYQFFLLMIVSLASIWVLQRLSQDELPRVRDAYYRGMYPLVPFVLIIVVITLELLPLAAGSSLYELAINNGIALGSVEQLAFGVLFTLLGLLSLYLVAGSLFALYVVCAPDMTPRPALQLAKRLVKYRRWLVVRKVLFLPLVLFVIAAVITLPFILFWATVAPWLFFVLSLAAVPAVHAYLYTMYRAVAETVNV